METDVDVMDVEVSPSKARTVSPTRSPEVRTSRSSQPFSPLDDVKEVFLPTPTSQDVDSPASVSQSSPEYVSGGKGDLVGGRKAFFTGVATNGLW